eukprot:2829242-Pleurochrysis_carterae.AAC.2
MQHPDRHRRRRPRALVPAAVHTAMHTAIHTTIRGARRPFTHGAHNPERHKVGVAAGRHPHRLFGRVAGTLVSPHGRPAVARAHERRAFDHEHVGRGRRVAEHQPVVADVARRRIERHPQLRPRSRDLTRRRRPLPHQRRDARPEQAELDAAPHCQLQRQVVLRARARVLPRHRTERRGLAAALVHHAHTAARLLHALRAHDANNSERD